MQRRAWFISCSHFFLRPCFCLFGRANVANLLKRKASVDCSAVRLSMGTLCSRPDEKKIGTASYGRTIPILHAYLCVLIYCPYAVENYIYLIHTSFICFVIYDKLIFSFGLTLCRSANLFGSLHNRFFRDLCKTEWIASYRT